MERKTPIEQLEKEVKCLNPEDVLMNNKSNKLNETNKSKEAKNKEVKLQKDNNFK